MSSTDNRLRRKWQDYSGRNAGEAEKNFFKTFNIIFEDTNYKIRSKPKEFNKIYIGIELSTQEKCEIYNPPKKIIRHGICPDYAIDNKKTDKTIYVEVKRQDGWIEGKSRSSGRGNAHERSCKFFTPGLLKILRKEGNHSDDVIPFWVVFQGDITRDPCRVREIKCWYDDKIANYFFWRDSKEADKLIEHFEKYIEYLLN